MKQKFPSMAYLSTDPNNIIVKINPKMCYFVDYRKGFWFKESVKY